MITHAYVYVIHTCDLDPWRRSISQLEKHQQPGTYFLRSFINWNIEIRSHSCLLNKSLAMSAPNNLGGSLAAEIDGEVAKFRAVQEDVQKLRNDLQIVMGQSAENEMVLQELSLLDEHSSIFKMVGPVLIKNSHEDAKETVTKRLEFITSEKDRLEGKLADLEKKSVEIAQRVQQMQGALQKATVAAVQQIQQQHGE